MGSKASRYKPVQSRLKKYTNNMDLTFLPMYSFSIKKAGMAELVDAPDSKSGGVKPVRVRVSLPAFKR